MSVKKLFLFFVLSLPVSAAEPWNLPLFTSDPRAVSAAALRYPIPEGLDAIILDYAVHVELDGAGKMHKTTRTVERVIRLQGIEGSRRVLAHWASWRENRPKIRARVITADGKPHMLDEASISEPAVPGGSPESRVLFAELPSVDIDSVIEVETEQSDREAADPDGRWDEITVTSRYLIAHFSALIETASAHKLRVETRGFRDVKKSMPQTGSVQQVKIEDFEIAPGQSGILLPPDQTSLPTIDFSTATSWQSVAQWYAGVLSKASLSPPGTAVSSPADQLGAIEKVFEDIQKKVKSTDAALGADPYTPQTPAETLKKGSGNSKDKAVLLISKLAEIGIPANAALIRSAPGPDVLPGLPGLEAFNRMVVYVPGQHPAWIDPDAEFTPVSRLPLMDQDRWALIVDPLTTDLVRTPESIASENREIATTEIQLEDGNEAKVLVTIETHGAFEDLARPVYAAVTSQGESEKRRMELVERSRVSRITKLETGEPLNLLAPYALHFTAEGYAGSVVTDAVASVDLPGAASTSFEQFTAFIQAMAQGYTPVQIIGTRKTDYYAPPAFIEDTRYHVIPPPGYHLSSLPPISTLTLGPLTLSSTIKAEADGSVRVEYSLANPKSRYTTQEVSSMLRDFQKLQGKAFLRIVFTNVAEEKIASGELKEGIALLRRNAESAAENVNATLRLASAYVQAGARAEAIKLCQKALASDPKNAYAYARLGWIYTHDEFGRQFRPGMNMGEAEKAYLKAIESDPDGKSYVTELAALYTYNSAGVHYGRSARLDDALQKFREVGLANLAKYNALNEYAVTLLVARRYDEVKQVFLFPQGESVNPAIKLAAIAATGGATDVKEEADFIAPAPDKQRSLLLGAAQYLLIARQYQAASMLFKMARVQAKGASEIILEKVRITKDFDESTASTQPAIAALQRLIESVLNPVDPEDWKKQVAPESRDQPGRYRSELFYFVNGSSTPDADPSTWPFISDLLTTTFNFAAEGSDALGYRIRVADPTGKGSRTIAYVVKRGSEYLVLGLSGSAASSGEAFSRLKEGDLAGARQWLDWAKDELPPSKLTDPMAGVAFERLWPARPAAAAEHMEAAAAIVAARGRNYQPAISALEEMRERLKDPDVQSAIDQGLAQSFLQHQKFAEAIPVLERLRAKWPNSEIVKTSLAAALTYANQFPDAAALIQALATTEADPLRSMRLEERLLAQEGKLKDAAALEARICANPKATAFDWNDLAWIGLFAQSDEKTMREAAAKAMQMTQDRNASILQTLAVVQASTGLLQQARVLAYHLMDEGLDPGELLTVFGRIAEQVDVRDAAIQYYRRVEKPEGNLTLSNYAFAQMRLKELATGKASPL